MFHSNFGSFESYHDNLDMTNDEAQFSVEAQLENQVYKWANKYKERMAFFHVEFMKILMKHIEAKQSSVSKLQIGSIFSIFNRIMLIQIKSPENLVFSIVCTLATSGISTIKRIMTLTIRRRKLSKDINSTYSIRI